MASSKFGVRPFFCYRATLDQPPAVGCPVNLSHSILSLLSWSSSLTAPIGYSCAHNQCFEKQAHLQACQSEDLLADEHHAPTSASLGCCLLSRVLLFCILSLTMRQAHPYLFGDHFDNLVIEGIITPFNHYHGQAAAKTYNATAYVVTCATRNRPQKKVRAPMACYNAGAPMERITADILRNEDLLCSRLFL